MEIKLEMGVPVPTLRNPVYEEIRTLPVGGMKRIPAGCLKNRTALWTIANRAGIRITTRKVGDDLCVWRVA